jgi:hypothetical protein
MNERIRELAVKAQIYFSYDRGPGTDNELQAAEITQSDLEKFAELIVRECAEIYDKIDNGNLHMGTDDYLEALNKTFRS